MSEQSTSTESRGRATLAELSEIAGGRIEGDARTQVRSVAPVEDAGPDELAFLALSRYGRFAPESRAGAFLVSSELAGHVPPGRPKLVVDDAYTALVRVLEHLHPAPRTVAYVHPTAVIGTGARLEPDVTLEPYAVVGANAQIGSGTTVGAHSVVGRGARVGRECVIHPHVVLYPGVRLGDRVVLHSGVRIGSDGFGYVEVDGVHHKIPQVGRCVVGNDVEVGANTAVDRGSIGDTVLGDGVKIDNLVQVAHNVRVGAGSLMAALVGVAGSTRIGEHVWVGGQVSAINHLDIGDGARLAFGSTVMRDVKPGETISGSPARPHRESLRKLAHLERLPRLVERVQTLEARISALEAGPPGRDGHR